MRSSSTFTSTSTHSTQSPRHALDLAPTHVRQEHTSLKKAVRRRTIADSIPTLATGSFASLLGRHNQRCIVKISYTKNSKTRSWAAHGEYLQRAHAQTAHEKGHGFNQESDAVDLKRTLREWQREGDEHVFKLIISPENGHQMDLKKHAKDLVAHIEKDLRTKLEWAAIDHYNTDHPHLHLLVRGKDKRGNTVRMERDYLSRGIRHRSQELATQMLGLRLNRDRVLARTRQVEREYVTDIDKSLLYKAVNSVVSFVAEPPSDNLVTRELRLLQIRRLQFLEKLGLAERMDKKESKERKERREKTEKREARETREKKQKKEWKLCDHLESTLREMQLSNDIIKSRARHNIQTVTHELPVPTQLQARQPLTGKVVGMGLEEELYDRRYLLLEGIDGKVHYIQATPSIIKSRDQFEFTNGNVITLEKKTFTNADDKPFEYIQVHNHHTLDQLQRMPSSRLDRDVIEWVKTHSMEPKLHFPEQCFANDYANVMTKRFHELVNEKMIITQKITQETTHEHRHYRLAPDWERQLSRVRKEREHALHVERTHRLRGHSIGIGYLTGKHRLHHLKHSR